MSAVGDNSVAGLYGFTDAAQTHLELLMNRYMEALSTALTAEEGGTMDLSVANELRDQVLRSLELAAVAAQMDGQTAADLIAVWLRR